jgi:ATP-dependent Clp protease protease subunit
MQHNRLMALLVANRAKPKRYEIVTAAEADEATIYLYDTIDPFWGVSAKQFVKDLNAIKSPTIHLRINSPGGDVFDGRAIATAIAQHPSKVIAHIDGLAASAASYVAIAADEVEIAAGAFFMIHKAWTIAFGNADDLKATAGILEQIDESLVKDYARKTDNTAEQIAQWMAEETWFEADEAVEKGFADRVAGAESDDADASASNVWDLSAYRQRARAAAEPAPEPVAPVTDSTEAEHAERRRRVDYLERIA